VLTFAMLALFLALTRETIRAFGRRRAPRKALVANVPPEQPVAFGPGRTWLAVATDEPARVLEALAIDEPVASGWSEGLAAAATGGADAPVFVTPPVSGWVLIVSRSLPDLRDVVPLVERLGRDLDARVQAFQADGPCGRHGWILVEHGELRRAYVYHRDEARPVLEVGHATAADDDIDAPDDDDVMHVAADASLDPTMLATYPPLGRGWLARWPRPLPA
jgi:hypothetical protein